MKSAELQEKTCFKGMLAIENECTSFQGMLHSLNEGVCWKRCHVNYMCSFLR